MAAQVPGVDHAFRGDPNPGKTSYPIARRLFAMRRYGRSESWSRRKNPSETAAGDGERRPATANGGGAADGDGRRRSEPALVPT